MQSRNIQGACLNITRTRNSDLIVDKFDHGIRKLIMTSALVLITTIFELFFGLRENLDWETNFGRMSLKPIASGWFGSCWLYPNDRIFSVQESKEEGGNTVTHLKGGGESKPAKTSHHHHEFAAYTVR